MTNDDRAPGQYLCGACDGDSNVRVYRGARVLVALCDECALSVSVCDGRGRELRVRAAAVERFRHSA